MKERALEIASIFQRNGLAIHPTSGLGTLLASARRLSDDWLTGQLPSREDLLRAMHIDFLCPVVRRMGALSEPRDRLKRLLSGALDFFDRSHSNAKDAAWEYGVLDIFAASGIDAEHNELPDVVMRLGGRELGVACKCIYSLENLESTMSKAVKQLDRSGMEGIVALSLSELLPAKAPLVFDEQQQLTKTLVEFLDHFIREHLIQWNSYFIAERVLGILASVTHPVMVARKPLIARQTTMWNVTGDNPTRIALSARLRDAVDGMPI
jgi:hypothetical protein